MKSPRTLVAALCALAFAVSPAHALAQSGAGDDQYSDPFAGQNDGGSNSGGGGTDSGSGSGGGTSGGQSDSGGSSDTGGDTSGDAGLSTAPPDDSSLTTPPPLSTTSSTGTAATSQATLPNTGVDTRILVGAGIALLLMGIGLRLRTADERRY